MPSPLPRPESHRALLGLAAASAVGLLLGLALIVPGGDATLRSQHLQLYGAALPAAGSEAVDAAVERVERRFQGYFNLEHDGVQRPIAYAELGVALDRQRLRQMVREAGARAHRPARGPKGADGVDLVVPVQIDRARAVATLLTLKHELDQVPVNARLDLDLGAVIPERAGRLLDVDRSLAVLERAIERGADGAPLAFIPRPPRRFARELADLRHDVLLGAFETRYDTSARARDRAFNLQLTASRLDGQVLMPGGTFDFNVVVGPRDEAHGYRLAPGATGELIDDIDRTTSQVSGTLHAAALFAGLDIVERHAQPLSSTGIELGFDAAVTFPAQTLRLKNPYDFPVVLRETIAAGRVRAEIRGARRPHTITIVRRIVSATPYATIETPDDSLARGVRVVAQRGVPGLEVHRYRIRRDGAHAVRQRLVDHYPPTPQLLRVGTGATSSMNASAFASNTTGRPPHDPARELRSDELVIMSQSEDPDGPLLERRRAGRFGVPGWSKDVGSPAWKPLRTAPETTPFSSSADYFFGDRKH